MEYKIEEKRIANLKKLFISSFKSEPFDFMQSTGRLEIIGNHVDHNSGICLVSSVANLNIVAAVSPSRANVGHINIKSKGFKVTSIDLNDIAYRKEEEGTSTSFVKGILNGYINLGYNIGGFDACFDSNIFRGAGVSSSAAYCTLICKILSYYYNNDKIDTVTMAKVSRFAENKFFGKNSGLLDQIGCCSKGFSMVDFKDQENPVINRIIPNFSDYDLVLLNTLTDHSDCSDAYGSIVVDMKKIATTFHKQYLRDVDYGEFLKLYNTGNNKDLIEFKRAKHYFDENARVLNAFIDIKNDDIKSFLKEINDSGLSSENLLQNIVLPGEETNNLEKALHLARNVIKDGAVRVHGGGFGGTILAFINKTETEHYIEEMSKVFGKENILIVYTCSDPLKVLEVK
ncbi:MAG: galactokinase family protein [Bacilli bacterium]